jgi:hypothetical protein
MRFSAILQAAQASPGFQRAHEDQRQRRGERNLIQVLTRAKWCPLPSRLSAEAVECILRTGLRRDSEIGKFINRVRFVKGSRSRARKLGRMIVRIFLDACIDIHLAEGKPEGLRFRVYTDHPSLCSGYTALRCNRSLWALRHGARYGRHGSGACAEQLFRYAVDRLHLYPSGK